MGPTRIRSAQRSHVNERYTHFTPSQRHPILRQVMTYRPALLALCVVAVAMRLAWLDSNLLSRDEGSSWRVSRYSALHVVQHCATNVHAPLSFLLLKAWTAVWGESVFAIRALSGCYGVLCVPLTYYVVVESTKHRCGRAWGSPDQSNPLSMSGGGFVASVLATFHPVALEASRTARMYSLGMLLALVSTWLLLRAIRCNRTLPWLAYSLSAASLAYTHVYGLFVIAVHFSFGYVCLSELSSVSRAQLGKRLRLHFARLMPLGSALGVFLVLYSPWLPVLRSQTLEVADGYWIPPPTPQTMVADAQTWLLGEPNLLKGVAFALFLSGLAISAFCTGRIYAAAWLLIGVATIPWVIASAFYWGTGESVLQVRYLAMAQTGISVLVGLGVSGAAGVGGLGYRNAAKNFYRG